MAGASLLLVDDDAPIRRMLERTLTAEGYEVVAAADGGAALAAVERSMPDAIVLDVSMPGLDGLAVTRRLRSKGLRVPILLLTARAEAELPGAASARAEGAQERTVGGEAVDPVRAVGDVDRAVAGDRDRADRTQSARPRAGGAELAPEA